MENLHILLAEFNIYEGSILKHQFPQPTGADEHLLAELMLPDGVHARSEDWTVFFLNQTPAVRISNSAHDADVDSDDNPELLYVLNLVRTKMDQNAERGALVKGLAICYPYPHVHVFKPLLLLALEDYFNKESIDVLASLHRSISAVDLALMPRLSLTERVLLRTSERKDLFEERFSDSAHLLAQSASSRGHARTPTDLNKNLPIAPTNLPEESAPVRNGRSPSSSSNHESIHSTQSQGSRGSDRLDKSTSSNTTWVRPRVTSGELTRKPGQDPAKKPRDTHFFEVKLNYATVPIPIRIPIGLESTDVGDYSIINLVQTFNASSNNTLFTAPFHPHLHTNGALTPPIILLFNALITGKRIVFLGSSVPASQVASLVLAACALGSGCGSAVLKNFTPRAFPYSNLANKDYHDAVPGAIVGVTNSRFEAFTQDWDVFCNVDTGKITVSKDIRPATGPSLQSGTRNGLSSPVPTNSSGHDDIMSPTDSPSPTLPDVEQGAKYASLGALGVASQKADQKEYADILFVDEILGLISSHAGEALVRARFSDYLSRFLRLAARYEEEAYGHTTIGWPSAQFALNPSGNPQLGAGTVLLPDTGNREISFNGPRIEGWKATKSYLIYKQEARDRMVNSAFKYFDLQHQLSRLRLCRQLPRLEVEAIFTTLAKNVKTDEQIIELLSRLPAYNGGLLPLAFGFFHPSSVTRDATVELFSTMEAHPVSFLPLIVVSSSLSTGEMIDWQQVHFSFEPVP